MIESYRLNTFVKVLFRFAAVAPMDQILDKVTDIMAEEVEEEEEEEEEDIPTESEEEEDDEGRRRGHRHRGRARRPGHKRRGKGGRRGWTRKNEGEEDGEEFQPRGPTNCIPSFWRKQMGRRAKGGPKSTVSRWNNCFYPDELNKTFMKQFCKYLQINQ